MGCTSGLMTRAILPVACLLALVTAATAITFNKSPDAFWAFGCDWPGKGDLGKASTKGEGCSKACGRFEGCTHFTWTPFAGGTCFLKSSRNFQFEPFSISTPGAVCGKLRGQPEWAKKRSVART